MFSESGWSAVVLGSMTAWFFGGLALLSAIAALLSALMKHRSTYGFGLAAVVLAFCGVRMGVFGTTGSRTGIGNAVAVMGHGPEAERFAANEWPQTGESARTGVYASLVHWCWARSPHFSELARETATSSARAWECSACCSSASPCWRTATCRTRGRSTARPFQTSGRSTASSTSSRS
ncbi:MAG: hypothetical protein ACO1OB_05160 [Archangium sp.]